MNCVGCTAFREFVRSWILALGVDGLNHFFVCSFSVLCASRSPCECAAPFSGYARLLYQSIIDAVIDGSAVLAFAWDGIGIYQSTRMSFGGEGKLKVVREFLE